MHPACVLIAITSGSKVLDFGSGVVLGHGVDPNQTPSTYILTCAHNLRAWRKNPDGTANSDIYVNGKVAKLATADTKLHACDLCVLTVSGEVGQPALYAASRIQKPLTAHGYIGFFESQFGYRAVLADVDDRLETQSAQGDLIEYLKLVPISAGKKKRESIDWVEKGMSGGPVMNNKKEVVGISRLKDGFNDLYGDPAAKTARPKSMAYAIELTPAIWSIINLVAAKNFGPALEAPSGQRDGLIAQPAAAAKLSAQRPSLRGPLAESIAKGDIQKGRFGDKSEDGPYKLDIRIVDEYARYFLFDAIITAKDGSLQGPFIYYLHDSYNPSVIWVRKTDGRQAVLSEIVSDGTYTFGVQFRTNDHQWRTLEFDLAEWEKGRLKKYD
jgi:hypothetical protein